jgi:antitoxin component of RelBE/YafQ-DinJ toxin-antitoxin module
MFGLMDRSATSRRQLGRRASYRAAFSCERLEERQVLSSGFGLLPFGNGGFGPRMAEMASMGYGRGGMFRGGGYGFGGGMTSVTSLLITPSLLASGGQSDFPSYSAMSSSTVQQALKTLQTDLQNDNSSGTRPTHESVGALQDDLDAIRQGTLSGTAAQSKIQSDQAAILSSMGLTSSQITQIQSDQQAVLTAIQSNSGSSSTSTSSAGTATSSSTTSSSSTSSGSTTIKPALQTLQSDLKTDTPSGARPTHASIGAVQDDLDAIRKGTLSGSAAVTQVQTDAAAVLSSMGLTQAQITQIQSDQQALETAVQSNSKTSTASTTSSTTASTMQSVAAYLVGIPDLGMRGLAGRGMGIRGWA